MRQFLSNISSQIYSQKKIILCGLAIALFFSLVPLRAAQAGLGEAIFGVFLAGLFPMVTGILVAIAAVVELVFKAGSALLAVVISGLANITVTPGLVTTPSFVLEGWKLSQGLVNIVFILILTFIGLATILRLQSYQLQKTLPSLIIIALLVNFSGLLVGFFADMGNILTNVFIGKGLFSGDLLGFTFTLSPAGNVAKILFYLVAISILFIIALMFIVRMVILWVLTILAPLAFGAYVLPGTKKYWTQWLSALIQWSLFTIPIAFFMYLARLVLQDNVFDWSALGFFSGAFPPIAAIILLFLGITLSMQLAPAGAQGVINFGKKLPGHITNTRLGAKAAAWGASKTQGALSGLTPALKNLEGKGPLGKVAGMALRPSGWAAQGVNRLAGGKLLEYAASKRRMTLPKNFDQMSEPELEEWAKANYLSNEDTVQLAARMQDKKKYKHTSPSFKKAVDAAIKGTSGQRWLHPDIGSLADVKPEDVDEELMVNMMTLETLEEKLAEKERVFSADPANAGIPFDRKAATDDIYKENRQKVQNVAEEILEQAKSNSGLEAAIRTWAQERGKPIAAGASLTTDDVADLAAAKMYAVDLKPGDIPNILNPNSLAFSLAVPDANPETLHRLFASFDKDKVEKVLSAPGGLNDISDTKEKLIELQKKNPRLVRAVFNSSGYQHIDLEARRVLREEFGDNYKRFLDETSPQTPQPMPLRTSREINAEIAERSNHIQDIEHQVAPLEARKAANVGTPQEWQNRNIDQNIHRLVEQENKLTSEIDELTDELSRVPKERTVLREITDNRFAATPAGSPKTKAEVEQEVRTEYEQKYRPLITSQIKQEAPFIRWSAEQAGVTQNQAMQDRIRQLYGNLRLRDIMPPVTPAPSSVERKVFEDIARGSNPLPPTTDPEQARKLAGSLTASLQLINSIEEQINRLSQEVAEVERRHGDASNQRSMRDTYQTQLDSFNRRKEDIRKELGLTP